MSLNSKPRKEIAYAALGLPVIWTAESTLGEWPETGVAISFDNPDGDDVVFSPTSFSVDGRVAIWDLTTEQVATLSGITQWRIQINDAWPLIAGFLSWSDGWTGSGEPQVIGSVVVGPPGPTAVSADAGNVASLGSDGMIFVAQSTGETGTGTEILPTFRIDTAGGAAVTTTITYVAASYSLSIPGEGIQTGTLRIRGRGNYTWGLPKKPYRLNFEAKTSPLGMSAFQKDWALLANHDDPRKLGNIIAWTLGAEMSGLGWTPQWREVELVLNGDYLGLYLLSDLVRLETGRVPGTKASGASGETVTGAWLAEISRRYLGEAAPGFTTTTGVMIQYDTPEVDLASTDPVVAAQAAWFRDHIQAFEDALFLPDAQFGDPVTGYPPYIDTQSFADWYLINELASNQDSNFDSSCKLWKERDSGGALGKIHMGPLWDFGISFGNVVNYAHPTAGWYTLPGAVWIQRLVSDPAFKALLLARWQVLKALIPLALDTIDAEIQRQGPAIDRDVKRWNSSPVYTSEVASRVKAWLTARVAWLDGALPTIPGVGPAILPAPDVFSDVFSDSF